jgi:hypothetical protein
MPKITNLKSAINAGKSVVGQVSGALEDVAGAAGKGGFSVSAGPNGVSISANFNELLKKKLTGNKISSPVKELFNSGKLKAPLIYPDDLDNEHYIIFTSVKRSRMNMGEAPKRNGFQNIVLPIPSNLTVGQGASYSDTELGILGGMAAGRIGGAELGGAASSLGSAVSSKIASATAAFKNGGGTDATIKGVAQASPVLAAAGAGAALGGLGGLLAFGGTAGDAVAGIKVDSGLAVNPHLAVVFEGVGFRTHQFTYKMIARNQQESDVIKNIINTFKYNMLPSYTAGTLALTFPDEWEIEFASSLKPYLYDIGTCVLENVNVNYNGEGMPVFFENSGAPVSIEITLSFKETQIFTKERLEDRIEG